MIPSDTTYQFPQIGEEKLKYSPVVVGSGPAGLFCACSLALMGYAPIILERGKEVREREKDVLFFWKTGILKPESNVQFGEGGAGTFSDGKLNTLVKDPKGRNRKVLETFVEFGAPSEILYDQKPHIGTDILVEVVENLRGKIIEAGGTFLFETCFIGTCREGERITGIVCKQKEKTIEIPTELLVLAIGHSARDTFELLEKEGFHMEAKAFAMGFRVEHPQREMNEIQYGKEAMEFLPAAPYKVTANIQSGRGVYSFCMCPGGYVVNASSEEGRLAVNGMSYRDRGSHNANSAIIVTVTPEDFGGTDPLSGVRFQRHLEEKAYEMAQGNIPQQLFGDFRQKQISSTYGDYESCTRGKTAFAPLHELFGEEINRSFLQGMEEFGKKIKNFDRADCILSGVESRTSSPVRITRSEAFESNQKGVYPCGEGAGYAGGIMSAAMDGLKVAEAIISKYSRPYEQEIERRNLWLNIHQ